MHLDAAVCLSSIEHQSTRNKRSRSSWNHGASSSVFSKLEERDPCDVSLTAISEESPRSAAMPELAGRDPVSVVQV